ncbi:RepB family plasmid replication initiator protein [Chryseobacterium turcicum]|uniref:RepB family plasmid replication initiator protein n=1 Tax=Chryseobacterium turcicum TaxID=2898076 RepID=A0A9Q3V687_9FLAO|nr:RepB family plasmid replication initiator protein [Chryseobacterium turcicum]MCD1118101.1 RepB family plasmid replication initiator protein [Chryseobacterium turcicum]
MMDRDHFSPKPRKKVLISNDFREVLISQETSIIEQRIITTILSAIKDQQSLFINVKSPVENQTQLSFDDCYDGWSNQGYVEFLIPFQDLNKELKEEKKMKNFSIKQALVNMTNVSWLTLRDESINGYSAVPFIISPKWNSKNIYFKMDKAVMKHLLNMNPYFPLKKDLPYNVSSPNTLRFLMWLLKFRKQEFIVKEYSEILKELSMPKNKYENRAKFERDFLRNVKADLDSFNDLSFNYNCDKGIYSFVFYDTKNSVGDNQKYPTINELQITRSLKYLKKKRNLSEIDLNVLKKLFEVKGHRELSKTLNGKIDAKMQGDEYIKAVFVHLENPVTLSP